MAKVTSKRQVTVPKTIADHYGIKPGDDIRWVIAGDAIRVVPPGQERKPRTIQDRLRLFDRATDRQKERDRRVRAQPRRGRGWTREELYTRGGAR